MGWDFSLAMMPYGDMWRAHRRASHQKLRYEAALELRPIQLSKIHELLVHLSDSPNSFMDHLKTQAIHRSRKRIKVT